MHVAAADAWEEGAAQAVSGGAEAGGARAARLRVQGQVQPAPLLGTCEGGLRAGGPSHSVPCVEAPAARHTAGVRLQEGHALLGACWLVRPAGPV
jgi:hypothetical protein